MLKTVTRALQLMQVLGANPDGMSLAELASVGATNKQDAFRLVKALSAFQFVSNDPQTGKIILGIGSSLAIRRTSSLFELNGGGWPELSPLFYRQSVAIR